jgi:hypothetical protein
VPRLLARVRWSRPDVISEQTACTGIVANPRRCRPPARPGEPGPVSVFATPRSRREAGPNPSNATPQRRTWTIRPVIPVLRSPRIETDKPSIRASTGRRRACLEPVWERPAGPNLNSRRPELTLGQTRPARQELVRVPESNTKYGGKIGKTGASRPRDVAQVSVSPQGFPTQKIRYPVWKSPSSRCSQGRYFLRPEGCTGETHVGLRGGRSGMPAQPWPQAGISGKVRADSIAFLSLCRAS